MLSPASADFQGDPARHKTLLLGMLLSLRNKKAVAGVIEAVLDSGGSRVTIQSQLNGLDFKQALNTISYQIDSGSILAQKAAKTP